MTDKPVFLGSLLGKNNTLGYLKMAQCTFSENLDGFCHCMLLLIFQKYFAMNSFNSITAKVSKTNYVYFEMPNFGIK